MAALATTDEVASSLCSASIEWGICIATPANRLPTAPTVTLRHVTGRCAPRLRVVAAASRIRAAAEAGVLNRSLRRPFLHRRINARISRDEFTTHRAVRIENPRLRLIVTSFTPRPSRRKRVLLSSFIPSQIVTTLMVGYRERSSVASRYSARYGIHCPIRIPVRPCSDGQLSLAIFLTLRSCDLS